MVKHGLELIKANKKNYKKWKHTTTISTRSWTTYKANVKETPKPEQL
jgi:hypothetical protein